MSEEAHRNAEGATPPAAPPAPTPPTHAATPTLEELLATPPVDFNAEKITQMTLRKIAATRTLRIIPRKVFRVSLIAAAILAMSVSVAYAVAAYVTSVSMGQQDIGFFTPAPIPTPTAEQGAGTVSAPQYFASSQPALECYGAAVGITQPFDTGTITLDYLAVDDNFINAFFTITYEQPFDLDAASKPPLHEPYRSALRFLTPPFAFTANGAPVSPSLDIKYKQDTYLVNSHTLAVMWREVIPNTLPNQFDLSITTPYGIPHFTPDALSTFEFAESAESAALAFNIQVDKSAATPYTSVVEPGLYSFNNTEKQIAVEKLVFTPAGAVITIGGNLRGDQFDYGLGETFAITDDKGTTALVELSDYNGEPYGGPPITDDSHASEAVMWGDFYESATYQLFGLDSNTKTVTFTPITNNTETAPDPRSADLRQVGTRVDTSPVGGFVVTGYEQEDLRITVTLKPYGLVAANTSFVVDSSEYITLTEDRQGGVINQYIDAITGDMVITWDYYAARPTQLAKIDTWGFTYNPALTLDKPAALILPLKPKT